MKRAQQLEVIAAPLTRYQYHGRLIRVVDGDTVVLDIDQGLRGHQHEHCRIWGINAPEMKGHTLMAARASASYLLSILEGEPLEVRTFKDTKSFDRFVAHLRLVNTGEDVDKLMIAAGHAEPYEEG